MAFVIHTKCPRCKKIAKLVTTTIRAKLSTVEKNQREMAKKMVKDLLHKKIFLIKFPATSAPETRCDHCGFRDKVWGWTDERIKKVIIFFPRQTFFLPRDEFTDTVAHEPSHALIGIEKNDPISKKHGKKWYFQYRKNREKLFQKYKKFIDSSKILVIKYHKSYGNLYPSHYEIEYNNHNQELTNEQLEQKLAGNNCCGQKMVLVETHKEKNNKVCYKYVCSQCKSDIFVYGEKPKN